MQQLNSDYLNSGRNPKDQYYYLNIQELMDSDMMQEYFFTASLKALINSLEKDIDN